MKELKENTNIYVPYLTNIWNEKIINHQQFPDKSKTADVTPVFKKGAKTALKNYRPVSVLSTVSNFFERLI